jgi:two-component system, cell cycle response regulator DivK
MIHYFKRILIVEDNDLDARLMKDLLERYGYETLQTGDGWEAINLAHAHLPALILMDLQLPEISGLEVTRRLKADDRSRRIPIIAVTAFATGWHEQEALDSRVRHLHLQTDLDPRVFEYGRIIPATISPLADTASLFPGVPNNDDGHSALCAAGLPRWFEHGA